MRSPPVITSTAPWHFCSNMLLDARCSMLDARSSILHPASSIVLSQWQRYAERAAFVNFAFHVDSPAVQPDNLLRQGEAQAGAGLLLHARVVAAEKLLEYL